MGNDLLYLYLKDKGVKFSRVGKAVVAQDESEKESLLRLKGNGEANGVKGLRLIDRAGLKAFQPGLDAPWALLVPSTGILDSHGLMQALLTEAKNAGASVAFNSDVSAISKVPGGYRVIVKNEDFEFETKYLINCAGLGSDRVAVLCGIDVEKASYKLYFSKGDYFRANRPFGIQKLIYPVPEADVRSLGIHLTPDLAGGLRLGPDSTYVDKIDHTVDQEKSGIFASAVRNFLPTLEARDLNPDTSGIRPKLQGPNDGFRDFVISEESSKGFPGLVNLVGIESPGLTSCLAIAEYVEHLLKA